MTDFTCYISTIETPLLQEMIYSSEWNTDSEVYCRDRCLTSEYEEYEFDKDFYYEATLINVATDGYFTIMINSSVQPCGYLYETNFDPSDTSLNLLRGNNDSIDNEQFKLTTFLRASSSYVLVATTFSPYVTGQFSIIVFGMSSIVFFRVPVRRTTTETSTLG